MQMDSIVEGGVARLVMSGRFDFTAHREFRRVSSELIDMNAVSTIVLDFGGLTYLDSAALGMLLMARERSENLGKRLSLTNCRGSVAQVLEIANFHKLFDMA